MKLCMKVLKTGGVYDSTVGFVAIGTEVTFSYCNNYDYSAYLPAEPEMLGGAAWWA
jgi:hypothetical protein